MSTAHLRKEYTFGDLRRKELALNPFHQFNQWFQQALDQQPGEPHAMILATADKHSHPSARTVLLKGVDERGFIFYTNYESRKGCELAVNPHAALVFYWPTLERQVCITGSVTKTPRQESEAYFKSRPLESQLAAWLSKQSEVIHDHEILEDKLKVLKEEYRNKEIPLPSYWGGFILSPKTIEFWQGRPNRLHNRFRYTKKSDNTWLIERLAP